MIIEIKKGGRGRPIKIDTEKARALINENIEQVKLNLQSIRKSSSGLRDDYLLGTNTSLPKFINITDIMLGKAEREKELTVDTAKDLRQYLKAIKELGSRTEKVRSRALGNIMFEEYEADLKAAANKGSKFSKKTLERMIDRVKKMNAREKQEFFTSKNYQDIKTISRKYKHIKAWSEKKAGKHMTHQEAAYYLIEQRQLNGDDTTALEQTFQ